MRSSVYIAADSTMIERIFMLYERPGVVAPIQANWWWTRRIRKAIRQVQITFVAIVSAINVPTECTARVVLQIDWSLNLTSKMTSQAPTPKLAKQRIEGKTITSQFLFQTAKARKRMNTSATMVTKIQQVLDASPVLPSSGPNVSPISSV